MCEIGANLFIRGIVEMLCGILREAVVFTKR